MKRDIDYVVKDGQVIIVDEFTGRLMYGRRYNEGLHQAIEAKEGVSVASENKTLATITFQNFFRLYAKLSGMTGTAHDRGGGILRHLQARHRRDPDEQARYPHRSQRRRLQDRGGQVPRRHPADQATATTRASPCWSAPSPSKSPSYLSKLLKREGVPHTVLNAKHHEREAEIVAQAGKFGAVTISTNMAGRGTDIMLGGNAEYMALSDLRKQGLPDELIAEANSYAETENPEILAVRESYKQLLAQHKAEIAEEAAQVRAGRRPVHRRHGAPRVPPDRQSAPRPCRPSGRPRRNALLSCRWRTTSCACSAPSAS